MKLVEALKRVAAARGRPSTTVRLAVGFEPLHLATFLAAHFADRHPDRRLDVQPGLHGDLLGPLRDAAEVEVVLMFLEWADLDARLGLRAGAVAEETDVLDAVRSGLQRIEAPIRARVGRVVLVPPSLPIASFSVAPWARSSRLQLRLSGMLSAWLAELAELRTVVVVDLAGLQPQPDPRAVLASGFPYALSYASGLAERVVAAAYPAAPKKGLITDLDGTLWSGIVGDDGSAAVQWSLEHGAQHHGLYQLSVAELMTHGVLVAVASKNEEAPARAGLAREDLRLDAAGLFPVVASWQPKSRSVEAILRAWNIAASDVVFVDDSPHELAEVSAAHPDLTCLAFPREQPDALPALLETLRRLFGRGATTAEDRLRADSIRSNATFDRGLQAADDEDAFLRSLGGVVTVRRGSAVDLERVQQLIAKTNQFNLNGQRMGDAELRSYVADPRRVVLSVAYRDRHGPLGTIAAVLGEVDGTHLYVRSWVMSCRAFSRRIEHHTLSVLADDYEHLTLDHATTARNAPLGRFLSSEGLDEPGPIARPRLVALAKRCVHAVEPA